MTCLIKCANGCKKMNVPLVSWNWKISLLTVFLIILVALYSLIKQWPTFTNGLINFSNGFTNLVTKPKMFYKLDVKLAFGYKLKSTY